MDSLDDEQADEIAAPRIDMERQMDAARALAACLQSLDNVLSEGQRNVFRLRYCENQSTREIAENLGKSMQAVKISLFRTRRALEARNHGVEVLLAS
jgi:RNA polymerase sigma factor (sigma-70 family)